MAAAQQATGNIAIGSILGKLAFGLFVDYRLDSIAAEKEWEDWEKDAFKDKILSRVSSIQYGVATSNLVGILTGFVSMPLALAAGAMVGAAHWGCYDGCTVSNEWLKEFESNLEESAE